jgi:hypothetical protein
MVALDDNSLSILESGGGGIPKELSGVQWTPSDNRKKVVRREWKVTSRLQVDPRGVFVMNGRPGHIQFYDHLTQNTIRTVLLVANL